VGALSVGGRPVGEPLTERDHRLLADVGRQLAVAVHAASLTTELAAAHRRLLEAREVERRKLRDDLHDGLGPSLAAIAAGIEVVRLRLDEPRGTDAEVTDVLDRTLHEVDRAIASTRTIVRGLRPPVLDELGLFGALEERCRQPGAVSVKMEADPTDLAALPAAVEVAILHLVDEAVTNVSRHADATHCCIRLEGQDRQEGAIILVTVVDDGDGIPVGASAGVGLASMRQRVTELGGHFQVASDHAGTRVTAWLPVGETP
jgi:signal transduction histidine kinase